MEFTEDDPHSIFYEDDPNREALLEELSSDPNLLAILDRGISIEEAVLMILEESAKNLIAQGN